MYLLFEFLDLFILKNVSFPILIGIVYLKNSQLVIERSRSVKSILV